MKLLDTMFSVERSETDRVQIRLHADHVIYQAHFPGNPITPGVCLIQIAGELLEQHLSCRLRLSQVVNLKFVVTVSPTVTPVVDFLFSSVVTDGTSVQAKGTIEAGHQLLAKFSLVFNQI